MQGIITVCLGRNISFDLYVQDYMQLENLYDKTAAIIQSNCANTFYIMAGDTDTAERFSKMLGNKTVVDIQRSGHRLEFGKAKNIYWYIADGCCSLRIQLIDFNT